MSQTAAYGISILLCVVVIVVVFYIDEWKKKWKNRK